MEGFKMKRFWLLAAYLTLPNMAMAEGNVLGVNVGAGKMDVKINGQALDEDGILDGC